MICTRKFCLFLWLGSVFENQLFSYFDIVLPPISQLAETSPRPAYDFVDKAGVTVRHLGKRKLYENIVQQRALDEGEARDIEEAASLFRCMYYILTVPVPTAPWKLAHLERRESKVLPEEERRKGGNRDDTRLLASPCPENYRPGMCDATAFVAALRASISAKDVRMSRGKKSQDYRARGQ